MKSEALCPHSLFFWGVAKRYQYGSGVAATDWNSVGEKKKRAIEKAPSRNKTTFEKG